MKLQVMQPSGHSYTICKLLLLAIRELLLGRILGTRMQEMEVLKEISIPDQSHLTTEFLHTDTNLNKNVARPFNTEEGRNMHN
jgi:glucose-6-phosphate-specific signal transduction histidine kinase